MPLVGSFHMRYNQCQVEIRLFTELRGERRIERMNIGFHHIPQTCFFHLARDLIDNFPIYSVRRLRASEANRYFVANSGRGERFYFMESAMATCTRCPRQILITIEIGHRDRV